MTRSRSHESSAPAPIAVCFAVQTQQQRESDVEASLTELEHLLRGLGVLPRLRIIQRRHDSGASLVLGKGKLEELENWLDAQSETDRPHVALVFDGELTAGQQRALAQHFDVEVLDRTQVILRVFSQRARTRTAQMEIELAQISYDAPRIRDDDAIGTKQTGGGGRAAKGHTSVELRKQQLRRRMATLREELAKASNQKRNRTARRSQVSRVALVGYTNAGKSSWMRVLSDSEVLVEDALFATLDTTVRTLRPKTTPPVVVADTVGFLRNLPNHLLASFRSTLDEALDADLLVIVVDGSDTDFRVHWETTLDVLRQVNADHIPRLVLANKRDRTSEAQRQAVSELLPEALFVSALDARDVEQVHGRIASFFQQGLEEMEFVVPFDQQALRAEMWAQGQVLSEHFDEAGGHLRIRADAASVKRWRSRLTG